MAWTDAGRRQLEGWGLSEQQAAQAGLFEVADASVIGAGVAHRPGIVIPYYMPDGGLLRIDGRPFARVRWLDTPSQSAFGGRLKAPRYGQPKGTGVQVYFPPLFDWAADLADSSKPLIITEGEAKAITACLAGFRCLALGGVYNFATRQGLVPALAAIEWKGRPVVIIYDSDAATNPAVLAAEARLVEELGTQRGASVRIVRLPEEGSDKVGLDDFIHRHGPDELGRLIAAAPDIGALDAKVIALNRTCAWIEQEGKVLDLVSGDWIDRGAFMQGSQYSTLKHVVAGGPKSKPKVLSVAQQWLRHPHAQRYSRVIFRPGEGISVPVPGGRALNLWTGWDAEPGDVTPWLRLIAYLTSRETNPEIRTLPIKLLAYKAQHPQEKIPLALVFTGTVGSGKTMWMDSVVAAFAPWSAPVTPDQLVSIYNPWLEKSVVAAISEMDVETLQKHAERIKALITDEHQLVNDKYRSLREINSPTFYMLNSNWSGVGAGFSIDDRRMVVIECPGIGPDSMYEDFKAWLKQGGAKHLMHYLLHMDLGDWEPPRRAPMTASKHQSYREGMSPIQLLAADMRESDEHVLLGWLDMAMAYGAQLEMSSNAHQAAQGRAIVQGVGLTQVRPWYTAEELALIFAPVLAQVYAMAPKLAVSTPGQVSRQLRDSGIPYLVNLDDPYGFRWGGRLRQYLVVSGFGDWDKPIHQADFERKMREWPTYASMRGKQ